MRHLLATDYERHVLRLAVLSGIVQALDNVSKRGVSDRYPLLGLLAVCLIGGAIGGIVSLYVGGLVFHWSGRLFGGKAYPEYVRTALAWGSIPDVVLLILYVPLIAVFGQNWFDGSVAWLDQTLIAIPLSLALVFIGLIALVYKLLLLIQCLAEVHGISAWRGLGTLVVGAAAIGATLFVLLTACRPLG